MSGNETLLAPENVEVSAATAMPDDAAYTYQRNDGTVERAMNAEDAIARCPVLGKLAIEAPDQANILLELAVAGNAKIQVEEQQQKPVPNDKEKIEPKPKPETTKPSKPEPEQVKTQDHIHETSVKRLVVEPQLEATQHAVQTEKTLPLVVSKPAEKETVAQKHTEPAATEHQSTVAEPKTASTSIDVEKEQHVQHLLGEVYQQHTISRDEIPFENRTEQIQTVQPSVPVVAEHFAAEPVVSNPDVVVLTVERVIDMVKTKVAATFGFNETATNTEKAMPLETIVEHSDEQPLHVAEIAETDTFNEPEFSVAVTTETDGQFELRFEPQAIETYKELLALIEGEATTFKPSETSENIIEPDADADALGVETVVLDLAEPKPDFEEAIALRIEEEEFVPLEAIVEQADEQPLEQTLVQLAQYLTVVQQEESKPIDNTDTAEQPTEIAPEQGEQINELRTILLDITEVLPRSYYLEEETSKQRIKLTPELTERLLLLLSWLGYEHSKEALVEFVRLHGLAYLLQVLHYLCQLNDADERKELFVAATTVTPSSDNTSVGSLMGNAVLKLLAISTFANEY